MNWICIGVAALAALCLYLASPHQAWRATPWPAPAACTAGALLLAGCMALLWQALQPATAVFSFFTWLMLLLALWPCTGALLAVRRAR